MIRWGITPNLRERELTGDAPRGPRHRLVSHDGFLSLATMLFRARQIS